MIVNKIFILLICFSYRILINNDFLYKLYCLKIIAQDIIFHFLICYVYIFKYYIRLSEHFLGRYISIVYNCVRYNS